MKAIGPMTAQELCSQSITLLKMHENVKSHNSSKNCQIKTAGYDQLSYKIGKLSDQQPCRSCIHKSVARWTNERTNKQNRNLYVSISYAGYKKQFHNCKIATPNTHIEDRSFSWLGTGTSVK